MNPDIANGEWRHCRVQNRQGKTESLCTKQVKHKAGEISGPVGGRLLVLLRP